MDCYVGRGRSVRYVDGVEMYDVGMTDFGDRLNVAGL